MTVTSRLHRQKGKERQRKTGEKVDRRPVVAPRYESGGEAQALVRPARDRGLPLQRETNDDDFISSVFPRRQKKEEKLDCVTDRRLLCDKRKGTGSPCSARWPSLKRWRPKSRLPRALQAVAQRSVTSRASPISVVEALSHWFSTLSISKHPYTDQQGT